MCVRVCFGGGGVAKDAKKRRSVARGKQKGAWGLGGRGRESEPVKDRLAASAVWTEMSPLNGSAGLDAGAPYLIPLSLGVVVLMTSEGRGTDLQLQLSSQEGDTLFVVPSARGAVILSWKLTISMFSQRSLYHV